MESPRQKAASQEYLPRKKVFYSAIPKSICDSFSLHPEPLYFSFISRNEMPFFRSPVSWHITCTLLFVRLRVFLLHLVCQSITIDYFPSIDPAAWSWGLIRVEAMGVWNFFKEETPKSLFILVQLGFVTSTMALLETSNKTLAAISILTTVSVLSFGLFDLFQWYGTTPLLVLVALMMAVAVHKTLSIVDQMGAFSAEFKIADADLNLDELKEEERRQQREVRHTQTHVFFRKTGRRLTTPFPAGIAWPVCQAV